MFPDFTPDNSDNSIPGEAPRFTVSDFISVVNDNLEMSYPNVEIVGEVSSFKISQGRWVFFDLKDNNKSISCFMTLFNMRTPIEDGMKLVVKATPKITDWGKFSLTVSQYRPLGEGSIKKAFDLLKEKLQKEGLFAPEKKRPLPTPLSSIGVISSTQAAGYADFIKILNARWGGLDVKVAHTMVQGMSAPDQIIAALNHFNEKSDVQLIVMIRGGGSKDDLSVFNDEKLVRAVAASKIPVMTGIGHEIDETLADLAADLRASTPSNVAELIVLDRKASQAKLDNQITSLTSYLENAIENAETKTISRIPDIKNLLISKIETIVSTTTQKIKSLYNTITTKIAALEEKNNQRIKIIEAHNPEAVLRQGYAILSGKISPGSVVKITTNKNLIDAKIVKITERNS